MMSLRVASVTGSRIAFTRAVLSKPGSNTFKKKIAGCRSVSNEPGQYQYGNTLSFTHTVVAGLSTYYFIKLIGLSPLLRSNTRSEIIFTTKDEMQRTERTQVTKKTQGTEWTAENQQKDEMFETLDITIPEV